LSGGINYFTHIDPGGLHDWWHNEKREPEKGYTTDLITTHALEFIGNHKDQPFCLYVPYGAVHIPHMGPHDESIVRYDQFYGPLDTYKEMLAQVDLGVDRIVELLRALALDDQTFVFLTSDNGADRPGSNRPLRGWKGEMYEGGIRVPAIGWWPGKIRGGRQTAERTATMDLFPTLVALAGMDEASRRELALDGVDLTGLLVEDLPLKPRPLYFRFREWKAVIDGPWKLILLDKQWNTEKRGTAEKSYLYNLENDLSEQNNLVGQMPEMVDKLTRSWNTWSQQIDPELQRGLKWARRTVDNFGNAAR
jgi:arylsulfatase A